MVLWGSITHLVKESICCAAFLAQKYGLSSVVCIFNYPSHVCAVDWLTLRAIERDKWHAGIVLCIPIRPIPSCHKNTHTRPRHPFTPIRPILITIICWYPSTQTTVSKFNWFSISRPVDREMRSLSSYSCLNDCLPGVGQSAFRKCRRGVLHLNEPVVVLPLSRPNQGIADAALYSVVLCCPVEWQDENLEIMLFGFTENLHWRELSWYS